MENLKALGSLFLFAIAFIVVLAAVCGLIMGGIWWASARSCEKIADKASLESEYSIWTDCMVKVEGEWIPLDKWRVIND
jgi:hypothetical protein